MLSAGSTVSKSAAQIRVRWLVGSDKKVRAPKCWNGRTSIVRSCEEWSRATRESVSIRFLFYFILFCCARKIDVRWTRTTCWRTRATASVPDFIQRYLLCWGIIIDYNWDVQSRRMDVGKTKSGHFLRKKKRMDSLTLPFYSQRKNTRGINKGCVNNTPTKAHSPSSAQALA